jgi:hypothetical protein
MQPKKKAKDDSSSKDAPSRDVRNYVYDAKAIVEGFAIVNDQIRRKHDYRNKWYEIERERRKHTARVIREFDPEIAVLDDAIAATYQSEKALKEAINERSKSDRKRSLKTGDEGVTLSRIEAERKRLKKDQNSRKRVAYRDAGVKAKLAVINDEATALQKLERSRNGVSWGTYQSAEIANKQSYAAVKGERLPRWRRWPEDGFESSVAVHIQDRILTWAEALLCNDKWIRIQMPVPDELRPTHSKKGKFLPPADPESKRSVSCPLALVWIRLGTADDSRKSPVWAKVLTRLHRQPPPDAVVKWVFLHRSLVGRTIYWRLRFVLDREEWPRERGDSGIAGVEIGYRMIPGEGLRVACFAGSDGKKADLVIPYEMIDRWHYCESQRANRDRNFNAIKESLAGWLRQDPRRRAALTDALRVDNRVKMAKSLPSLYQWESPDRLQELVWLWRNYRIAGDRKVAKGMDAWRTGDHWQLDADKVKDPLTVYGELEAWRKQDRHLHELEDHLRAKLILRRNHDFRTFAAEICKGYRIARIKDINWARVKERPTAGKKDNPLARLNAQIAAPGTFQAFLIEAMGGANVERFAPGPIRTTCHRCGERVAFDPARSSTHLCEHCGAEWEYGANNATNLLAGVGERVVKGEGMDPDTEPGDPELGSTSGVVIDENPGTARKSQG